MKKNVYSRITALALSTALVLGTTPALFACAHMNGAERGTEHAATSSNAPRANANTADKRLGSPSTGVEGYAAEEGSCSDCIEIPGGSYTTLPVDPNFNTEEYKNLTESGFIATATRPLSTLSSDVDTAAYANLRRMINSGYSLDTIPADAVRIEEMLNYFDYQGAKPAEGELFGTSVHLADCPWNSETKLLVMNFATPSVAPNENGSNIVLLIDVSGSMASADKLPLLKQSLALFVETLIARDRISIVTYSGSERVLLESCPGNKHREILAAIDALEAKGCTNGEAGMTMAYQLAQENYIEGGVNRIIMASDGDLNVGKTSESDLHDYVSAKRDTGIYLSVLGFGTGNYKDNKMETLADAGNGNYHYIDCIEEAQKVLVEDAASNIVPLADDVKIQVEFNPATVKGYRLIGYENRIMADEDFTDDTKDAADVGPNAQFTVAYEIVPASSSHPVTQPDLKYQDAPTLSDTLGDEWLTCTMRYKPAGAGEAREQSFVVSKNDLVANPSDDWKFAAAVIEFGMVLRDSSYRGSATLESALGLLADMHLTEERARFAALVTRAIEND